MVKACCVPDCTANSVKNPERKFFVIPKDEERKEKWLQAIGRAYVTEDGVVDHNKMWSPSSRHVYVCSAHFITGVKARDASHPDYIPTLFPHKVKTDEKSASIMGRYSRATKRSSDTPVIDTRRKKSCKEELTECDQSEDDTSTSMPTSEEGPVQDEAKLIDKPLSEMGRDELYLEIENLRRERDDAHARIQSMEKLLTLTSFSTSSVEGNDSACQMMTGISWTMFMQILTFLSPFLQPGSSLPLKEQLFLTLVKLRHNLTFEFLAHVKGIPKSTFIDTFWRLMDEMYSKLGFMVKWSDRDNMFKTLPSVFKKKFPRLTSIIDCFEVFIESPKNLLARAQVYSNYKKHTTMKFFISCNPRGSVNFISKAWGGRASDIKIVRDSDFISSKYHLPGDQILADRGFLLQDDFASKCGCHLLSPSFTKGQKQLSARDVEKSRSVSSVRIHVERVIGLLKNRFTILKGTLPLRCVQSMKDESEDMAISSADKIITVCAVLSNLGPGIV